ncbi:reverse transcriptase [Cucumis melo var. makuwa]|uniref:Reverse transcriptase n=1 Tax=Cucumis melo var. makuwa TaxID=1194695 RepID=A0A5A7UPV1_CUCMM|nr:reverse transcriptase [Cucumis melo var. makuwa]TYK03180.1 reverse transcriptase [Cucumis melo var. makuwa]
MLVSVSKEKKSFREIEGLILDFYRNLYTKSLGSRHLPLNVEWIGVSPRQNSARAGQFLEVIVKDLAKRLKKVMPSIIALTQSASIEGMQILDPFLIANEMVEEYRAKEKKGWILKLDLEKAFDRVDRDFLEKIM